MKKYLSIILTSLVFTLIILLIPSTKVQAASTRYLQEANMYYKVKSELQKNGYNFLYNDSNWSITMNDFGAVTSLDLSNANISNPTGITIFSNLRTLNISNNNLDSDDLLQIAALTSLTTLDCSNNNITNIRNLIACTSLKYLTVSNNDCGESIVDYSLKAENIKSFIANNVNLHYMPNFKCSPTEVYLDNNHIHLQEVPSYVKSMKGNTSGDETIEIMRSVPNAYFSDLGKALNSMKARGGTVSLSPGVKLENGSLYITDYSRKSFSATVSGGIFGSSAWVVTYNFDEDEPIQTTSIKSTNITLSKYKYQWNGKIRKPAVTVKVNGKTLTRNVDYKAAWYNNDRPGMGKVVVKGIGSYKGRVEIPFEIKPEQPFINSVSSIYPPGNSFKLTWYDTDGSLISGYQIQYTPSSNFSYITRTKTLNQVKKKITFSNVLTDTYYIRVRAFVKTPNGEVVKSLWSEPRQLYVEPTY